MLVLYEVKQGEPTTIYTKPKPIQPSIKEDLKRNFKSLQIWFRRFTDKEYRLAYNLTHGYDPILSRLNKEIEKGYRK